jgi:hypothetical protein
MKPMPRIVFSVLGLLGALLVMTGLLVQHRAVRAHARPGVPKSMTLNPAHWWPAWRTAGEMADARGVRSFVRGLELYEWGMTIMFFALGYIAGRW